MALPGTIDAYLKSIPLFALVAPEDRAEVIRLLHPVKLHPGQVLFREGERGSAMWVLGAGVEVSVSAAISGSDQRAVIAQAHEGETLGEMALIDEGARSGTAIVVHGGTAHQIDALDFATLRDTYSPPIFKILRRLCMELAGKLRVTSDRVAPARGPVPGAPPVAPGHRHPTPGDVEAFLPFQRLPEVVKLAMATKLTVHDFPDVTAVFDEGDEADSAYFVVAGEVMVTRGGITLATLGPGSMLGLVSLLDHGRRSATCLTAAPTQLFRLSRQDFDLLFHAANKFAFNLVELISRQLVAHLRATNALLGSSGRDAVASSFVPASLPPLREEDFLPEVEVLPLDLEMELEEVLRHPHRPAAGGT